ncbi:unnamed protein product [Toxocara canis]|uniref:RT_RNaseH_2 domain-containing protein n=1 Tax=Toxocara canis TaxID=6265 RepID=A0A183USK0_TOXCA|nr:unnamed protein product [Toxocara canis]
MSALKDATQLLLFLGLLGYYGNFVKEMKNRRVPPLDALLTKDARRVPPLDALLTKDAMFRWTPACNANFYRAKSMFVSDLLFARYDLNEQTVVAAHASNCSIDAVSSCRYPGGSEKAVALLPALLLAEENHSQSEMQGLILIFAVQKFR